MRSFSVRMLRPICFVAIVVTAASEGAYAACYAPDQQMSPQAVSDFMSNAAALLSKPENAQGGASLIDAIRDLVASNPATLPLVIGLLASANDGQQKAIGTGLGLAANLCARPDPNFATDISEQLAKTGSDAAKTSYAAIIGKPTGAVAGGGGGGGSSGGAAGGSTNPIGVSSLPSASPVASPVTPVFTTSTSYFSSVSSASASGAPSITNNVSSSVSK
jgi:hypothetical protein